MVRRSFVFVFVMSASLAFGQLDSNSITVTASRSTTLQPDQVVFSIGVSSGLSASLDDVIAALAGSGITLANFSGLNGGAVFAVISPVLPNPPQLQPTIVWTFTLPAFLSKMKDTVALLTALQKTITQNNSGLTLSFTVQGTQVSAQLQQSQTCSVSDLLSDARTQAQKLANAASLFLGSVLAMSSLTTSNTGSSGIPGLGFSVPPSCSLTVKFAVTR